MFELKPITTDGIPSALEKVERYRLLNEPEEAESICRDILALEPGNQKALAMLILTLTDQFEQGINAYEATNLISRLADNYQRTYYKGLVLERQGKAALSRGNPGSNHDAYEWLVDAMEAFEEALPLRQHGNDEAILRWNACARAISRYHLSPRKEDKREPMLE